MARIRAIAQGQSLDFSFSLPEDENGNPVTVIGFTCLMEVKQFPEQDAFISRIIPEAADALSWEGKLTIAETQNLPPSSKSPYYILAKITNLATDEQFEISDGSHRFHVTETFFFPTIIPEEEMNFFAKQLFHVQDQKGTGQDGGVFTSGAERTRELTTILTNEIAGASLLDNRFTLPVGKFYIEASAGAEKVLKHRIILRDITGSADLLVGTNAFSHDGDTGFNRSFIYGRFELTVISGLEIQHRCSLTSAFGFGTALGFGPAEIYTDMRIWRIDEPAT